MEPEYESEFMQLVMGLQTSAWMLLGKIANPISGKQERNLEAAKATIDALMMLKAKTKGNLGMSEEALLNGAIQQLQLNYVEELEKSKQALETADEQEPKHANDEKIDKKDEGAKGQSRKKKGNSL